MIVGIVTPSPLRRRMERVLQAESGVELIDLDAGGSVELLGVQEGVACEVVASTRIQLPADPYGYLADLLAERAMSLSAASEPDLVAHTRPGKDLRHGEAVTFPPPVGARWAREEGDRLVAPMQGDLGAVAVTATGIRGMVRLGVADIGDYLAAIAAVTPLLAAIRGTDPLDAAVTAGLELAEFVSA